MLFGVEIAMAVFGLAVLARGRLALGARTVVSGAKARILGVVALLPAPFMYVLFLLLSNRIRITREALALLDLGVIVTCTLLILTLGLRWATDPNVSASVETSD